MRARTPELLVLLLVLLCASVSYAQVTVNVDCTKTPPDSINAALAANLTGPLNIIVTGTCMEDVVVNSHDNVNIIGTSGAGVTGFIAITANFSQNLNLVSLALSNSCVGLFAAPGSIVLTDGITIENNFCQGAVAYDAILVIQSSTVRNNWGNGVFAYSGSTIRFNNYNGPTLIANNAGAGIYNSTVVSSSGNTIIENNQGWGIDARSASVTQFYPDYGDNIIRGNQPGGASFQENAEFSFWGYEGSPGGNLIQNNGSVGIFMTHASQGTLSTDERVFDHKTVGVDVSGHSQLFVYGTVKISNNGLGTDPGQAGIRLDGTSEATIANGPEISGNRGPGVWADMKSGLDITGATITGNLGEGILLQHMSLLDLGPNTNLTGNGSGMLACDGSSMAVADLKAAATNPGMGVRCQNIQPATTVHRGMKYQAPAKNPVAKWEREQYLKLHNK